MKIVDEDLKFLTSCRNEDLIVLTDYLTTDKDGKGRISESLTETPAYQQCYPDRLNDIWDDVAHELQLFGGNTLLNIFRGHGVPYREILIDVCKKMKVNFNKDAKIEFIEDSLLRKCLEDSIENMSAEDLQQLVQTMNIKTANYSKETMVAALQLAIRTGGFTPYKIAVVVANAVCKALLGRGLAVAANAALTRYMAVFAGPIGLLLLGIWTAIDIAGPAYRVTIPCCVQIAYMRRRSMMTHEQYLLECKK